MSLVFGGTAPQLTDTYPGPGSAEFSEVLSTVRKMILSPAMTAQIAVAAGRIAGGAVPVTMTDMSTGAQFFTGDLSETDTDGVTVLRNDWLESQIRECHIAERVRLRAPFPAVELVGRPGRVIQSNTAGYLQEERWGVAYAYRFDAVCWANGDEASVLLQRKALIYAECVMRMIRRDQTLGGLVKMIRAVGPVQAGGGGVPSKEAGLCMAAMAPFEAVVLQP